MIITEKDINEGIAVIDGYRLEAFDCSETIKSFDTISKRTRRAKRREKIAAKKRAVIERLLRSFADHPNAWNAGDTSTCGYMRSIVGGQVRKDCDMPIWVYWSIAKLIYQVAPILWKWWRGRQSEFGN